MLSLALLALAAGLAAWPAAAGRYRLPGLARRCVPVEPDRRWLPSPPALPLVLVAAGAFGAVLAGAGGAMAAAVGAATAAVRWRSGLGRRREASAAAGLVEALGTLVAELRAGAHPAAAMEAAAAGVAPGAAAALGAGAAAARLGGDVPTVLRRHHDPALAPWLARLADAWALGQRHGVPLAELLDAVRCDAEQRVRFAADVDARLAGPRATAAVLAGLPVLGLLLGQAIGADPWQVLAATAIGQLLLVLGTVLICAGVAWSGRITASAVPS
ncbi:MAG: secretion system protein [Pseudonocardiaceae bacterium]|nr:secretion system protein [Pseudonocardiaceae bacterium]